MGEAHISTLQCPSLALATGRVGDQGMSKQDKTKDVVVPGANGQSTNVMMTTRGKATYASVLKQPAHAYANCGVKWKNVFTD